MSNILKTLLNIDTPMFKAGLVALEKSTGNSGVDIRLIADIFEKSHFVLRRLGLDTKDTTARELYNALLSTAKRDDLESLLLETDYVLTQLDGKVISFNLVDVIENSHHQIPFEKQSTVHGQRCLAGELIMRYIEHARTHEATTLDIFKSMNLLEDSKSCYNDLNHKHKKVSVSKESD